MRRSGEEEADPGQQKQMLKEEAKENQLNSDTSCNDTDVSTMEKLSEEHPAEEQQTCMEGNGLNADSIPQSITEAKDIIVCIDEPQEVAISAEDNVQETERRPEGGDSEETSHLDLEETESKSSDEFRETCNKVSEDQKTKQTDAEESDLRNTEQCPQKDVGMGVMEVNVPQEATPAVSNTDSQQEPENTEEAENDEAEEIAGKSQTTAASGKKKKKKRRGKKKGNQQKDKTEQENGKTEKDVQLAKSDNVSATEPETLKKSNTEKEQQETEQVDTAKAVEPTEATSHSDTVEEQRMDHVTNENDKEQLLEVETVEKIKEVASEETHSDTEVTVDHVREEQNKEQHSGTEPVESVDSVTPTETSAHVETIIDLGAEPAKDNEQTLETSPPEDSASTSDAVGSTDSTESTNGLDKKCTYSEDNAESGTIATNGDDFQKESDIVDCVEKRRAESVDKMIPECTENNPEPNSGENTDLPNSEDILVDVSESTNKSSEREDLTSVPLPPADDLTDHLSSSVSEPSSELRAADDTGVEEETVKDKKELEIETEQECVAHTAVSLSRDGGESELEQDGAQQEECTDLKELQPDSSSYEETSNSCTSVSLMSNTDVLETEGNLLKTEAQVETIDEVVSQTEQTDDSNVSLETAEVSTNDALNTPDSPQDATGAGSSAEQGLSTEDAAVAEEPEQNLRYDQQEEMSPPLTEQLSESNEDKSEEGSPQPNQKGSDEGDDEDEEGQSFDFDDMDVEAAVATELPKNQDQVEAQEAVEISVCESNDVSSQPCESNSEPEENTQDKPTESRNNDGNHVGALGEETDGVPQDKQDSLTHEEAAADGTNTLSICEVGVVAEDINLATPVAVEEGLDAVKHELQSDDLDLPKSTEPVAGNKEPLQSGKDVKKNGRKGKGKGKEECKMS